MIKDVVVAVFIEIMAILLAPFTPLVVLFRGPTVRTDIVDGKPVERSALPKWLWWWQTPDEYLPGGLYEPTVVRWLKWGSWYTSWRWLLRNRMYGLQWSFGKPVDSYFDPVHNELVFRDNLWRWWKQFGPIVVQAGWKVHRKDFYASAQYGPFWAVPFVTIRLRKNS